MAKLSDVEKQIAVTEGEMTDDETATPEYVPIYQKYPNSKIPVAKSTGSFWNNRWSEGKAYLNKINAIERWDEAIRYYQNDQSGKTSKRRKLAEGGTGKEDQQFYTTENIVFANMSALVPATYAKNPDIEITAIKEVQEAKARMYEELIDVLFARKGAPGLHIKPKMRRAVVTAFLTNISYLELCYVKKEDSSEETVREIENLSKQLQDAKTTSDIAEIEGKLIALDETVNLLSESGPQIRVVHPDMVIRDPNIEEGDLSSDSYVIIGEFVRTSYIRAMYATKDKQGNYRSIYDPTHVMPQDKRDILGHDEEMNNFSLISEGSDYTKYGYQKQEEYDSACYTLTWKVWDKTTRRVLMFNDKDWSWPIWVWDDPYKLTRFFPIFPLQFYCDPVDVYGRSEVMYYLDQQDEINQCNMERARMRHWVMSKLFYDKNVFPEKNKLQQYLSAGATDNIFGIDLPQDKALSDSIATLAPPSTQFEQLFDTAPQLEAINRLSSVTPILQSSQFKTNTTNKAIESYEATTQTRLDEKIDAIEEILADIATATIEMCIQFMDSDTVTSLIGDKLVQEGQWINEDDPKRFQLEYGMVIVGGSTLKPTSKVKKEQAMNLGQVLGQFAQASPAVVLVMLKMIERAFSEDVIVTDSEWQMMIQSIQQQIGAQQAQQQQAQAQQQIEAQRAQQEPQQAQLEAQTTQAEANASAQETQVKGQTEQMKQQAVIAKAQADQAAAGKQNAQINQSTNNDMTMALQQVDQLLKGMPPEVINAIAQGLTRGVPLEQIAQLIMQGQGGEQPSVQ